MQRPNALPTTEVIRLLRNKVARNPGDLDAGLMLGSALYKAGDLTGSAAAFSAVLKQQPDHFQALLLLARSEARSGNSIAALKILARAQQADPDNPQAWQVAAALAADSRAWSELFRIAHNWTQAQPGSVEAWQALSRAHFEESRFSLAIAAYGRVLELEPANAAHLISAARLAIAAQDYQQARRYLDSAQEIAADSADLHYTLGRLLHMTGELGAAENSYGQAIAARPGFATAYVELGTLREGKLEDAEIQAVAHLFGDSAVHPEYRVMLGFTLGDALDRRKEYAQAFAAWAKANDINRKISEQEGLVYQPELIESETELLAALFSDSVGDSVGESVSQPESLELGTQDAVYPRPIFVLGMPRSATTLAESILASHTEVYGAGELPTLYDIHEELMSVARDKGLAAAREMLRSEAANWRERYLAALPAAADASSVVDKQPMNFRSIGLIRLLFPDSPIVCTQRAPMDVGLSIFRHKFSKNWPCAHRLGDIGHYYGVYARVVEFWKARYPGAIHWLDHAQLVKDPQTEISRLLAFAGLSPQPACFQPHQTKRAIATFSSVQVRQPLSAAFTGKAQRYASQLAPLRDALLKAGIDVETGQLSQAISNQKK